jgi:phosphoglycerate dehydrogenase-like enzyme
MHLLLLTRSPDEYKGILAPRFPDLAIHTATNEGEAEDFMGEIDILLAFRITDALLKKAVRLQWIQAMTAGVDQFLDLPSLRKDILVTSTRGIHKPQMSEMAFLFMLALNRRFPQMVRNQDQKIWRPWPTGLLHGKKVGILGLGAIGKEIARKCKAFDMTVYGTARTKKDIEEVDFFFLPDGLHEVIREVDYLINVMPLTPQTKRLIGARELSAMKSTAFLISLGRGQTIDEGALVQALQDGEIAGAALDVFCTEPLPKDSPLWEMKNVIITPHIGGMSDNYVEQILSVFENNLQRFLEGERQDLINYIER